MPLTWSHAFLRVNDFDKMLKFYTASLGFKISDRGEKMAFLTQLEDEHHQLAIAESKEETEAPSPVSHFAFRVESLDEIHRLYHELTSNPDVGRVAPVTHGNTWSIYFHDPERNGIEVFCDTPWDAKQPLAEPWDPQASREELERYTLALLRKQGPIRPNSRLQATQAA
ncbi:MAG: VOC family protein [Gammaproteobacteria bacterium]|nr:VOC family protein [Gammaproteobacteria bacterium]